MTEGHVARSQIKLRSWELNGIALGVSLWIMRLGSLCEILLRTKGLRHPLQEPSSVSPGHNHPSFKDTGFALGNNKSQGWILVVFFQCQTVENALYNGPEI